MRMSLEAETEILRIHRVKLARASVIAACALTTDDPSSAVWNALDQACRFALEGTPDEILLRIRDRIATIEQSVLQAEHNFVIARSGVAGVAVMRPVTPSEVTVTAAEKSGTGLPIEQRQQEQELNEAAEKRLAELEQLLNERTDSSASRYRKPGCLV